VLTERLNLATDPSIYADGGVQLLKFLEEREVFSAQSGRYDYGKLEYPFTLPPVVPDVTTNNNSFPPGRFHQDTFSGNKNITAFYLNTLNLFFSSPTSFYYHLDNSTFDNNAVLNLDATLLALLSHR
jgi:chorismate mutase